MLWIKSNAGLFLGLAFEADLIRMVAAGLDGKPRANLTSQMLLVVAGLALKSNELFEVF